MSLGEIFNPVDSFGNPIWKHEPDPRSQAKLFLQLLTMGNGLGIISDEQVKFSVLKLKGVIFDKPSVLAPDAKVPLPVSSEEYEEFKREEEARWRRTQDKLVMSAPLPVDDVTTNQLHEWIASRGGLDNVLKAIQKNEWADTSSWEKVGKKFTVADIKRLGKT